jgi:hypothetical protein
VKSQLENQNISFPAVAGMPAETKDQLAKWAEARGQWRNGKDYAVSTSGSI